MSVIVQKYGGSAIATPTLLWQQAQKVAASVRQGKRPVVVVSAMGKGTAQLLEQMRTVSHGGGAELDVVLSAGEQISCGLFAAALQELGVKARSWLGWQVPIHTNIEHNQASITHIATDNLARALTREEVPVIAGYQGVTEEGRITTLGFEGSDTTAVALAAALNCPCELYKDVDGVFAADPDFVPEAHRVSYLTYEDMLIVTRYGGQILHNEAVRLAQRHNIAIFIKPAFTAGEGTQVGGPLKELFITPPWMSMQQLYRYKPSVEGLIPVTFTKAAQAYELYESPQLAPLEEADTVHAVSFLLTKNEEMRQYFSTLILQGAEKFGDGYIGARREAWGLRLAFRRGAFAQAWSDICNILLSYQKNENTRIA